MFLNFIERWLVPITIISLIIGAMLLGGCGRGNYYPVEVEDKPSRPFKERCDMAKAWPIYKDHKGRWACKLDDGRVWTEED